MSSPADRSRLERIESLLAEDPQDTFLRYGRALELEKHAEHSASLAAFHELMSDAPPYVPAYFMAAQQLARLGRSSEAASILREGIEQARLQGNTHAAGEMSEFLASLPHDPD